MKVAFGLKAHSGWAALVVIGRQGYEFLIVDRLRVNLVDEAWAKQPYHTAENRPPDAARTIVTRGINAAHQIAARELQAALRRERERKNKVAGCAVLVGNPMPDWTVDEILAVHFRMHKAEGVLFRNALLSAAKECGLKSLGIPEKVLLVQAEQVLGKSAGELQRQVLALGKQVGAPWGKDQKEAALAAMIALAQSES